MQKPGAKWEKCANYVFYVYLYIHTIESIEYISTFYEIVGK